MPQFQVPISIVLVLHLKLPAPSAPICLTAPVRNPGLLLLPLLPESAPHHIIASEMFKESIHLSSAHCLYPGQGQPGSSNQTTVTTSRHLLPTPVLSLELIPPQGQSLSTTHLIVPASQLKGPSVFPPLLLEQNLSLGS